MASTTSDGAPFSGPLDSFDGEENHILLTNINQNPNLGLYVYATDSYALVGKGLPERFVKALKDVLKVPFHEITVAGTDMPGIFLAGNSHCLLVPGIAFPHELRTLEHLKIKHAVIETDLTCLGNTILCNDHHAYVSPEFTEKEVASIASHLQVPAIKMKLAKMPTPGALAVVNGKGMLVSNHISDEEATQLATDFKIKVTGGTVNRGNQFIKSGLVCNGKGLAIGDQSGSPEVMNADEALGFME